MIITSPLVSTIIPVFDRARFLREAVDSVLIQNYRPVEIVIVDDGSTDESGQVADELAGRHPAEVRVIHQVNRGAGLAREAGRLASTGEFIQYLDSDDLLLPGKFHTQVHALLRRPDCSIAYGTSRLVDEHGTVLIHAYKWTGDKREQLFPGLLVNRWWNTHTPLWRRTACDAVGPWTDMRFCEDWEYDARAGALRLKLLPCDGVFSAHRTHGAPRLTSTPLNREKLRDISRLLNALAQSGRRADVPLEASEWRHFSRWAFLLCRQCGAAGLPREAADCHCIALQTATSSRQGELKRYGRIATVLGWQIPGLLSRWRDALLRPHPGPDTMSMSPDTRHGCEDPH